MRARAGVVALLMACALGCTRTRITLGHPIAPADAAAIVAGLSKADVLTRLGPPDRVELEPGGSAFDYLYSRRAGRALDVTVFRASFNYDETLSKLDRLRVSFDRDGAVRYVGIVPAEADALPK